MAGIKAYVARSLAGCAEWQLPPKERVSGVDKASEYAGLAPG
jgi:hypothetical protein